MEKQWYVVNTYSGHENKVKEKLEMRAQSMDMKDYIFRVVIPEEKVIEEKKETKKEKKPKKEKKKRVNIFKAIFNFFKGVKDEMAKVVWPNKRNMIKYSIATIIFILVFAIYFYGIQVFMAWLRTVIVI